ncbi:hypothetical protein DOTSEDRAFT_32613 [Dothistroma septosporum NZE10]|uniref:Inner centromere protein ARK-binding domain-containing protein n=1 Tax=Dothistroma septosporum (strain NZE10 / CBS 128990) TaxID=675120 RepID=N1PU09_DOTSN|nr:hypothetical protein DOTSEDRAFT_32613 [Dothistroma septosporum NZE10]
MTTRTKVPPVGSAGWIQNDREQGDEYIGQEVEEFSFSVRNELEWLNEHMNDIFTKSQTNFADMFKTPGKLRGKTPRTARKVNAPAPRQPLTDIFAPNAQPAPASATKTAFYDKVAHFQIAEDAENRIPQNKPVSRATSPNRAAKTYTDSGYHGMMTEDEMELDAQIRLDSIATSPRPGETVKIPLRDDQPPAQRVKDARGDETGASDDSFVSAKETESDVPAVTDEIMADAYGDEQPAEVGEEEEEEQEVQNENIAPIEQLEEEVVQPASADEDGKAPEAEPDNDADMDMENGSPDSDHSSPQKPLQRKSSFTFSALPAREPLGTKRSMGPLERARSSFFSKSVSKSAEAEEDEDETVQEKQMEAIAHSKTSTQLLHERLNMLGKTKEPRASKSIPSIAQNGAQPSYPQLPAAEPAGCQATDVFDQQALADQLNAAPVEDEDDDWIAPTKPAQTLQYKASEAAMQPVTENAASPARPTMHQKSLSTMTIMSPGKAAASTEIRHQKVASVSHPNFMEALDSTTPAGSPMTKNVRDGPLSASKNRLWSALKSAKSIFASSASASAAAKLEAHSNSPAPDRSPKRDSGDHKVFNMPGALFSQKDVLASPARNNSVISFSPSRKTRSSTESDKRKEKELKAQQKAADQLEKERHKEAQKAAKQQAEEQAKAEKAEKAEAARLEKERKLVEKYAVERPGTAGAETASENEMPPPPPPKGSMLPSGKLRAPGRLVRPTREPTKPAPMSIKVASQSQRLGSSALGKSAYESSAPTAASKLPPRTSSAHGHRPGSAQPTNSRVRALEAAQRKKEADERAAAEKLEKKRELERKRAAKAEEEKRAEEERKAAEQQRVHEIKLAAHRKAAEKQAAEARKREQERQEQQRREQDRLEQRQREQEHVAQQRREQEQLRQQEDARKVREAHELAEAIRRERAQQASAHPRGDIPGTLRQLTKNTVPQPNSVKPAKRMLPMEDDENPAAQAHRPGMIRGPPSYQQADAKRRRTNEEQEEQGERRSVMAPPKRPSTMRKVCEHHRNCRAAVANVSQETLPKFSGYAHAPPPAAHHSNMYKSAVTSQHHNQHKPTHPSQLIQMSNARIPFGENNNPPASHNVASSSTHSGYENAHPSKFKTPSRPAQAPKSAKSTPHYPQGDNIELPDIATDSEDESDEEEAGGGFRAPSWVASPALRDLLTQQQLVDPETVFGPIGELKMDEVFKNSKNQERLKRFRDRGSSAMWHETGDAVTSAEKRRDMEMRERVVREGGWRYEPGA